MIWIPLHRSTKQFSLLPWKRRTLERLYVAAKGVFSPAHKFTRFFDKFPSLAVGALSSLLLYVKKCSADSDRRITELSAEESIINEIMALDVNEQLRLFHETVDPQNDEEARKYSLTDLKDLFAPALRVIERDEWIRIDRIGMRILGKESLLPVEWSYLKIAITGM